jgi:hypothetical protein
MFFRSKSGETDGGEIQNDAVNSFNRTLRRLFANEVDLRSSAKSAV